MSDRCWLALTDAAPHVCRRGGRASQPTTARTPAGSRRGFAHPSPCATHGEPTRASWIRPAPRPPSRSSSRTGDRFTIFDDPAVQGARRAVLADAEPADLVTTLLVDASHFAGSLTARRGPNALARLRDDPFLRVNSGRLLLVGAGLLGTVPAPPGPVIERHGSDVPWPGGTFARCLNPLVSSIGAWCGGCAQATRPRSWRSSMPGAPRCSGWLGSSRRARAVAEEVVQETWLAVLNGLDRFEGRSSLKTWVLRILVNRAKTRGIRERRTVPFAVFAGEEASGEFDAVAADRFLAEDRQPPAPLGFTDAALGVPTRDRGRVDGDARDDPRGDRRAAASAAHGHPPQGRRRLGRDAGQRRS